MIVNLLRGDLRPEIAMADEAFALSPINASAALPTDNDYDAICDAFMETSRGRWFLREYTKRNRNADTQMVLEAVARIEDNLARQKVEGAAEPLAVEPPIDIFPAIQAAMLDAREQIAQSFILDDNRLALDLIKGGMDTIRNVAWALRERGVDLQICGIFDHQVSLMMDGYLRLVAAQATATAAPDRVLEAFDELLKRVSDIAVTGDQPVGDIATAPEAPESETIALEPAYMRTASADDRPDHIAPAPTAATESVVETAGDADSAFREIYGNEHDIEIIESSAVDLSTAELPAAGSIVETDAIDDSEDDDFIRAIADTAQELARLEPLDAVLALPRVEQVAAPVYAPEPMPAPVMAAVPIPAEPTLVRAESAPEPEPLKTEAAAGTSLGHAVLRNGIVRPESARPNPMAAFSRMSQAEKIAFMT